MMIVTWDLPEAEEEGGDADEDDAQVEKDNELAAKDNLHHNDDYVYDDMGDDVDNDLFVFL